MAHILRFQFSVLTSTFRSRVSLQLEIAALRHQLSAYRLQGQRPRFAPPASPWQNAYVERVIGGFRRELLDHVIVLNQRHLKRLLSSYLDYYHPWRTHSSLDQDAPDGRRVRLAELGQIAEFPVVQGLHHYYLPKAA